MVLSNLAFVLGALASVNHHQTQPAVSQAPQFTPRVGSFRAHSRIPPTNPKVQPLMTRASHSEVDYRVTTLDELFPTGLELKAASDHYETMVECKFVTKTQSASTRGGVRVYLSHNGDFLKTTHLHSEHLVGKSTRVEIIASPGCVPKLGYQLTTSPYAVEEASSVDDFQSEVIPLPLPVYDFGVGHFLAVAESTVPADEDALRVAFVTLQDENADGVECAYSFVSPSTHIYNKLDKSILSSQSSDSSHREDHCPSQYSFFPVGGLDGLENN